MEISTLRNRVLVGAFATVMIVGSGVATALVTARDEPTLGEAVDTTASTGDPVDTTPSTPDATTGTTPIGTDELDEGVKPAVYWGPECQGEPTTNHGQYVSNQPKGGESRSTAAQSDCGKPLTSVGGDADEPEDDGDEAEAPAAPGAASAGPDASNGNGNGNANGRTK
jgi:hypothetical protein